MLDLTKELIEENIKAARNRTKSQKILSWTKTKLRAQLSTTSTLRTVQGIGIGAGKNIITFLPNIAKSIGNLVFDATSSIVPILSGVVSIGKYGVDYFYERQLQRATDARTQKQMGIWRSAIARPEDVAMFMQDISSTTFKETMPKLNDAMYKLEVARKDFLKECKQVETSFSKRNLSFNDGLGSLNSLAYSYGYYLHRLNRLRMYMDTVNAFMLQYEQSYEIFMRDVEKCQNSVTKVLDDGLSNLQNLN